jgi:pyruvate/2-oxoglutarate dehydrogenase complex dihydrolipoamide dehydrogenase (E3) component
MKVDVIVVGSGQAGVPLATRLARAGKRVLLAERGELGGTCVNTGCTPTKTMIASARAAHVARTSARLGVRAGPVEVDLPAVVDRKDAIVRKWREGVEKRLRGAGDRLTLVRGEARFTGERRIEVAGQTHTAEVVVLDVGARPVTPPLEGLESVPWLNYESVMQLRELPSHLLVLGGGYIGCEFGQMFRRFGAQVTMVDLVAHLLNREDPEISSALEAVFRDEGIGLELGAGAERVSGQAGRIALRLSGGRELRGSHLLVATGRRANTDDLGCDAGGIALDPKGFIVADDEYRTSASGTYAVGDAIGQPQFTHTAWDDHRILFDLLLGRSRRGRKGRHIPYTAFTDPQVAGVGLTEREAREQGIAYEMATMPFKEIARAVEIDEKAGILRVLLDPKTERVLGAAIVGSEAGELIHVFVTLMQSGATARAIVDAEFVHPTFAEGVQSLVMKLQRFALS